MQSEDLKANELDDFVIVRMGGVHEEAFRKAIDDWEMKITHAITNAPDYQQQLYIHLILKNAVPQIILLPAHNNILLPAWNEIVNEGCQRLAIQNYLFKMAIKAEGKDEQRDEKAESRRYKLKKNVKAAPSKPILSTGLELLDEVTLL